MLKQEGQELKYLGDITGIIKKHADKLGWEYIIRSSSSMGTRAIIYYSLKWVQEFFNVPVPPSVLAELKPGLYRRCLIGFFERQSILSPIYWEKLRMETRVIVKSLMMSNLRQSLTVIGRYRDNGKRGQWLRTAIWIPPVFGAALSTIPTHLPPTSSIWPERCNTVIHKALRPYLFLACFSARRAAAKTASSG